MRDWRPILEKCWGPDTSATPEWPQDCPSNGQCAVTALVIQDYEGGIILRQRTLSGSHYFNQLGDGSDVDLTSDQFGPNEIETEHLISSAGSLAEGSGYPVHQARGVRRGVAAASAHDCGSRWEGQAENGREEVTQDEKQEIERENAALRAALQRMLDAFEGWGETTSPACIEARRVLQATEAR